MKKIWTTILATLSLTGLILAGSEADNLLVQVLASTGGVMLFSAAMLSIVNIHRR